MNVVSSSIEIDRIRISVPRPVETLNRRVFSFRMQHHISKSRETADDLRGAHRTTLGSAEKYSARITDSLAAMTASQAGIILLTAGEYPGTVEEADAEKASGGA